MKPGGVYANKKLFDTLLNFAEERIVDMIETAVEMAKEKSPVREQLGGNNRNSIAAAGGLRRSKVIVPGESTTRKAAASDAAKGEYRIYTQSNYGGYLELGTSRMAARPYIAPSVQAAMREAGKR